MVRVVGIDPGTVTVDLCGLSDDEVFLDCSIPTTEALANDGAVLLDLLRHSGPLDLVAAPSGYGLPLTEVARASEDDLRLAFLAVEEESGGIGGLRRFAKALASSGVRAVFTPGVIHLPSVPEHRKINRVDLGTADKLCAAALAIAEQVERRACVPDDVSLILLELGGAFTAAVAVEHGRIIDGIGGTSGPLGTRASGALDGEVAFLAGRVSKTMLFRGGAATIAGGDDLLSWPAPDDSPRARLAWDAFLEGAAKAVAALLVALPHPCEIVLSGRVLRSSAAATAIGERLRAMAPVRIARGFARRCKTAAQGAALIADGLAGGRHAPLVEAMRLREARGTVLDHLYVIDPAAARERLGIT